MVARSFCLSFVGLALVAGCAAPPPKVRERLQVLVPADIDPGAFVHDGVRQSCYPEMTIAVQVFKKIKGRLPRAVQVRSLGTGTPALKLTIVGMGVLPRGVTTGQSLAVRADLVQDSNVVLSRVFEGAPHQYIWGSCTVIESAAADLGGQIAAWLEGSYAN